MKKVLSLLAMAGLMSLFTISCEKDPVPDPEPEALTNPTLQVSPSSVVIDENSEDIAVTYSWDDVKTETITPVYSFQITKEGDTEFSSGTSYEVNGATKSFTHAEIAALAQEIGGDLNVGFTLVARVRVTAKDNSDIKAVVSNSVSTSVSKAQYPIANLYPIGEATPYGWTQSKTEAMSKNGSVFSWTGHLYANAEFKFLLQTDAWWPGVVNASDDPFTYQPVLKLEDGDGVDKKFKVDKEGKYTVTIDASNTNDIKMSVVFIDDDVQEIEINELYVLGSACKAGWSLDNMEAFTKEGDIFTWEGSLDNSGEFRFPTQRDWWPSLMIAEDGKTLVKGNSDSDKIVYVVEEPGIYRIVCDVKAMTCELTFVGEETPAEFPILFMCGDATPYGWNTAMTDDSQLKPVDGKTDVLGWTGNLTASGTFKFLTKADWIPSYNRDATAADYWTLVYRENYDQPDEQFKVDADGTYNVVVNLTEMKVTCTKQ